MKKYPLFVLPDFLSPDFCKIACDLLDLSPVTDATLTSGFQTFPAGCKSVTAPVSLVSYIQLKVDAIVPDVLKFFGWTSSKYTECSFLKYNAGAWIDSHVDVTGGTKCISMAMCLNNENEYSGGGLRIYGPKFGSPYLCIRSMAGTLIAFDSTQYHDVQRIESGTRYSCTFRLIPLNSGLNIGAPDVIKNASDEMIGAIPLPIVEN